MERINFPFNVYISNDIILIQKTISPKLLNVISIEIPSMIISSQPIQNFKMNYNQYKTIGSYGIIGILNILNCYFLVIITKAEHIGRIRGQLIYCIKSIDFIPLKKEGFQSERAISREVNNIKLLYSKNFLYSFDYNLSTQFKNQFQQYDNLYVYNRDIIKIFNKIEIREYIPIVIRGSFKVFNRVVCNKEIEFKLIVRENTFNPQNHFVEYELIIFYQIDSVFTYVVKGMNIMDNYDEQIFTNLRSNLAMYIEEQKFLLINIIEKLNTFHTINKNFIDRYFLYFPLVLQDDQKYINTIQEFLHNNKEQIALSGFFYKFLNLLSENVFPTQEQIQNFPFVVISSEQKGKQNQLIKRIFWEAIKFFFTKDVNIYNNFELYFGNLSNSLSNSIDLICFDETIAYNFDSIFNEVYQGFQSLTMNDINSLQYFFPNKNKFNNNNNLFENKNLIFNSLHFQKQLEIKQISIFIMTWNVCSLNTQLFQRELNLPDLLFPKDYIDYYGTKKFPDFYILCLQEIVPLNPNNIIFSQDKATIEIWKNNLYIHLEKRFKLAYYKQLVGIAIFFFVKKENTNKLRNLQVDTVKTGFFGALGNKGSCILQFEYQNKYYGFAGSHFAPKLEQNEERIKQLNEIINFIVSGRRFYDNDYCFIFGDLNFRLNVSMKDFEDCTIKELLEQDQFLKSRLQFDEIIKEGVLHFWPTYKLTIGQLKYDIKKRVPAWCDRILYKDNKNLKLILYNSNTTIHVSDHVPVYAIFEISN